jgi:ankyrin repeat protein
MDYLTRAGADVNIGYKLGRTPLCYAVGFNKTALAISLMERGGKCKST